MSGVASEVERRIGEVRAALGVRESQIVSFSTPSRRRATPCAGALDGARGIIVETQGAVPAGLYALGPDEDVVVAVEPGAPLEDVMDVARYVLGRAREGVPSALWMVAAPGMERLDPALVERKLEVLVTGAKQARLYLAKEQSDI